MSRLTERQQREWDRIYGVARGAGHRPHDAAVIAWDRFKRTHEVREGKWHMIEATTKTECYGLQIPKLDEAQKPHRLVADKFARVGSLANTAYHVGRCANRPVEVWGIYEGHVLYRDAMDGEFYLALTEGKGQAFKMSGGEKVPLEDAILLIDELVLHERDQLLSLEEAGARNNKKDKQRIKDLIHLGMDLLSDEDRKEVSAAFTRTDKGRMMQRHLQKKKTALKMERSATTNGRDGAEGGLMDSMALPAYNDLMPPSLAEVEDRMNRILRGGLDVNICQGMSEATMPAIVALFEWLGHHAEISHNGVIADRDYTEALWRNADKALAVLESEESRASGRGVKAHKIMSEIFPRDMFTEGSLKAVRQRIETDARPYIVLSEDHIGRVRYTVESAKRILLKHLYPSVDEMVQRGARDRARKILEAVSKGRKEETTTAPGPAGGIGVHVFGKKKKTKLEATIAENMLAKARGALSNRVEEKG